MKKLSDYLHWAFRVAACIRGTIVASIMAGSFHIAAGLGFIFVSKHFIDVATSAAEGSLWSDAGMLVAILLMETIAGSSGHYVRLQADVRLKNHLRQHLFEHLLHCRTYNHQHFHSGDLTARLEEDVRIVSESIASSFPVCVVTAFRLLASFLFLVFLNSRLAWAVVLVMPFFVICGKLFTRRLRQMTLELRREESRVQSLLQESLLHNSLLKTLECTRMIASQLSALQHDVYHRTQRRSAFTTVSRTTVTLGFAAGYLITFVFCGIRLQEGLISFGTVTAFLQLVGDIQRPTVELARLLPTFIHASASIDRLKEIEMQEPELYETSLPLQGKVGLCFKNVSFAYPHKAQEIIHDFTSNFRPGSTTAILGETGVGKTTLFRLALALALPHRGSICIYNESRQETVSAATRCNFAFVPQGNTLLSGTIRDNLLLGCPEATDKDIKRVLHTAAADFVYTLPDGLDTLCGELGTGLSEGQAQRIAIARGLLRPGHVLLLDEISSSLDMQTEKTLFTRLLSACTGKTILFITHRREVSLLCDCQLELGTSLEPNNGKQNEQITL